MKITRTIDGKPVEIELTQSELGKAFREYQHFCDVMDAIDFWNYGSFILTDDEAEEIATEAREEMDYNDSISETRWNIFDEVGLRVLDQERIEERDGLM